MKYKTKTSLEEAIKDRDSVAFQEWCHFFAMNDPKTAYAIDMAIQKYKDITKSIENWSAYEVDLYVEPNEEVKKLMSSRKLALPPDHDHLAVGESDE